MNCADRTSGAYYGHAVARMIEVFRGLSPRCRLVPAQELDNTEGQRSVVCRLCVGTYAQQRRFGVPRNAILKFEAKTTPEGEIRQILPLAVPGFELVSDTPYITKLIQRAVIEALSKTPKPKKTLTLPNGEPTTRRQLRRLEKARQSPQQWACL